MIEPINISAIGWSDFKRSNPPGDYLVYGEVDDSRYFQLFHLSSSSTVMDGVDIHSPWGLRIFPEQIIYLIQEKYATREQFIDLLAKKYPKHLQYFLFKEEFLNG